MVEDAKFWVVEPRDHAERGLRPRHAALGQLHRLRGRASRRGPSTTFIGLDEPPIITGGSRAGTFVLKAADARLARHRRAGLLPPPRGRPGRWPTSSPRTARRSTSRSSSTRPTTSTSTPSTRFWNASGVDVSVGAERRRRAHRVAGRADRGRHRVRHAAVARGRRAGRREHGVHALPRPRRRDEAAGRDRAPLRPLLQRIAARAGRGRPGHALGLPAGEVVDVGLDIDPAPRTCAGARRSWSIPSASCARLSPQQAALGKQLKHRRARAGGILQAADRGAATCARSSGAAACSRASSSSPSTTSPTRPGPRSTGTRRSRCCRRSAAPFPSSRPSSAASWPSSTSSRSTRSAPR